MLSGEVTSAELGEMGCNMNEKTSSGTNARSIRAGKKSDAKQDAIACDASKWNGLEPLTIIGVAALGNLSMHISS